MNKIIPIIIIIILNFEVYTQNGWNIQTSGTAANLLSVWFWNTNTGIVTGQDGLILKTTNGGTNWINLPSGITAIINSVIMTDSVTALIGAADGYIYRSINGGVNWMPRIYAGVAVTRMDFINSTTGFAAATGKTLKTTDGGVNWTIYELPIIFGTRDITFYDQSTGWVSATYSLGPPTYLYNNYVMKTTNGGVNWSPVYSLTNQLQPEFYAIDFSSASTGFLTGNGIVRRSTSGGSSWTSYYVSVPLPLLGIYFLSDTLGYAAGATGMIAKSTNSGVNWTAQSTGSAENMFDIMFVNPLTGWSVGTNGTILSTHTGGVTGLKPVSSNIPDKFILQQNYPNPFNPVTKIKFSIPSVFPPGKSQGEKRISLVIHNSSGQEVTTLFNETLTAGIYEAEWDAGDFASGVYYYSLRAGEQPIETRKMLLIK